MKTTIPEKQQANGLKVIPPGAGESWWVTTNHQVMKLTADDTRGALSLWMEMIPPGGGPPPHVHYGEDEIFIVTEGEITFESGEASCQGRAGTVVFAPRGIPHRFQNKSDTPARMIVLVTPGGFDRFFSEVAYKDGNAESRPAVGPEEYERVVTAAARYDLRFEVPQPAR